MANNENTVQIQVEVLRAQLDKLIADINSLKKSEDFCKGRHGGRGSAGAAF